MTNAEPKHRDSRAEPLPWCRTPTPPDNFAGIRLIAAIAVIFGHSFPLTGSHSPGLLGNAVSTLAVKVFFVVSGYLVTESWLRDPHIGRYLLRRGLRIMPGLIVLCLFTVCLAGVLLTDIAPVQFFQHPETWSYFKNILLNPQYGLPGVFTGNVYPMAVNGSLWTLPVEFSMYLLMPLILVMPAYRFMAVTALLALAIASVWFTRLNVPTEPTVIWGTNLVSAIEMAPYFFWGAVYRIWFRRDSFNLQIAVLVLCLGPALTFGWASAEVATLLILPYCTLALALASKPILGFVEKLGDISYGTYLYAFLFQQIVALTIGTSTIPTLNFILALGPTLLLAFLSWHVVEKPALRHKPSGRSKPAR